MALAISSQRGMRTSCQVEHRIAITLYIVLGLTKFHYLNKSLRVVLDCSSREDGSDWLSGEDKIGSWWSDETWDRAMGAVVRGARILYEAGFQLVSREAHGLILSAAMLDLASRVRPSRRS